MAKTIKFNLIINNNSIRNLEDLRNNFCIEDLLNVYRNGLLVKWLSVRGFMDELEKVEALSINVDFDLIKALIGIFEIEVDQQKAEEDIYILHYQEQRSIELEELNKLNFAYQQVIDDYHSGYLSLIMDILDHKDNLAKIKANINELCTSYMELFRLHFPLFFTIIHKAPMAVMAMLMREELRPYLIYDSSNEDTSPTTLYTKSIYSKIMEFVNDKPRLKEALADELECKSVETDSYWKDLESKGKRYMIISMQQSYRNNNYVRNVGVKEEEFTADDVNGRFIILDGIDYKSNSTTDELLYMEV